jgi:hypothetical protein
MATKMALKYLNGADVGKTVGLDVGHNTGYCEGELLRVSHHKDVTRITIQRKEHKGESTWTLPNAVSINITGRTA